jgi:adenosylhomocysteine nucleosidase
MNVQNQKPKRGGARASFGFLVLDIHSGFWFRVSGFGFLVSDFWFSLRRVESNSLNPPKVIIFTALRIESAAVKRALSDNIGPSTEIHTIGILARHIPANLQTSNTAAIIMAGLAGALDPALAIGDVVIDDVQKCVPELIAYRRGRILTRDQIVATPAHKAELFKNTGALAVDMESSKVQQFASGLGIPFIGVRAISDTAAEILEADVVRFVDDFGRVKPINLAAGLLRRPNLVPYLNRLGKNSRRAADQLGLAVRKIVDCLIAG